MSRSVGESSDKHQEGPYRSPGQKTVAVGSTMPVRGALVADACLVLVIALTVVTVGRWGALIDVAARRFMGF